MNGQIFEQVAVGIGTIVIGTSGWLLPYRWNILRLKRFAEWILPERAQQLVPKIVGTVLIIGGALILIGTAIVGKFR